MNEVNIETRAAADTHLIGWPTLAGSVFVAFCGFYAWAYTFTNFAFEELGVGGQEIGITRSFASVPGIAAFAIGGLLFAITAARAFVAGFVMLGAGLIVIGVSSSWIFATVGAVAISFGQVLLYTMTNKMGIFRSERDEITSTLGRLKSYGPFASLVVTGSLFLAIGELGLRPFLVGVGIMVIIFGLWVASAVKGVSLGGAPAALRFRRDLLIYYAMNFVAGFRSQIFRTYVFILLVTQYAFPVERVAAIHLAGTVCAFIGYRLVGHLATRLGGARTLATVYLIVALLFVGFANITNTTILAILFLIDSLLFSSSVVTDAFLRRNTDSEFAMSDLGTGITLFHVAGVVAPLAGGAVIAVAGNHGAFYLGAGVALVGSFLCRGLR